MPSIHPRPEASIVNPLVSVGLPVYNGERFLARALDSILAQDFQDFELILADNASTDGTLSICQSYAQKDRRIRLLINPANIGAAPNHRLVFQESRGTYFKWAAHDDECHPRMLGECVRAMEQAPESVVLVYPRVELIDDQGTNLREYRISIDTRDPLVHRRLAKVIYNIELGTPMYGLARREALSRTRLIDSFPGSDYVLLVELAMLGEIWEIPEVLLRKRIHSGRSTEANCSPQDLVNYLDPSVPRRWQLPARDRLPWEYAKSSLRLAPSLVGKLLGLSVAVLTHYHRHNLSRIDRWKARLSRLFGAGSHRQEGESRGRSRGRAVEGEGRSASAPPRHSTIL